MFLGWVVPLHGVPKGFILEIQAASPKGGTARLYYDIGRWYNGADSCDLAIPAGTALQPYKFTIPAQPIKQLRLDLPYVSEVVEIGRIRLLTADGSELANFGPDQLLPMQSIESLLIRDGVARARTGANNPMLLIARPLQLETERSLGRAIVEPGQLLAIAIFVGALLVIALSAAARSLTSSTPRGRWIFVAAFLAVFGARLSWLYHYSHPMPVLDEWETDAVDLLIPLRGRFLDWQALFIPQGEHRILVTRLINLASSICNREWDPRVGMTLGALFYAVSVALLSAAVLKAGPRLGPLAAVTLVAWSSFPFDVANLYWGDQSQMYVLNLLAVCTLAIAVSEQVDPLTLVGGAGAAVISLFTMGSGFIAPAIAAGICLVRWRTDPERRLAIGLLGGFFLVAAIVGLWLLREAPFYAPSYARTWARFWPAFVSRASWPFPSHLGWAVLLWIPWLTVSVNLLLSRRPSVLDWLAIGLGAWALINALGLAHGRPEDKAPFNSKYYTSMSLGIAASILSTSAISTRWPRRRLWLAVCLVASLATVAALEPIAVQGLQESKDQHAARLANENLVRPFLATGDPSHLLATPYWQLPDWNGAELVEVLRSPLLQPWLPAVLRASAAQKSGSSLPGPQVPGRLTIAVRRLMRAGLSLFFVGIGMLAASIILSVLPRFNQGGSQATE